MFCYRNFGSKKEKGMKKKIGIVSLGYAWLPCEPGPSRFYYIAKMFAEQRFDVELIGSGFQHFEKRPRDKEKIRKQGYPFLNTFIDVLPYKKNIDVRRALGNKIAAVRLMRYLRGREYDLIYCSIPANNISAKVGAYCKEKGIPFVVDIEDLWPEAMEMVFHVPLVKNLLFSYFKKDAKKTYRNADAVIGTSDEFTNRAFLHRERNIPSATVYVGCDLEIFDSGVAEFAGAIFKQDKEFWVTYAGSIGASYDIRTLVLAAAKLHQAGQSNIKIKILGTGPLKEELEALAKSLGCVNVEFCGYVEYKKMAAYLGKSDLLINSFVKGASQSIVNKVGDYLAAGKPMINTLASREFMGLVKEYGFGANIEAECAQELFGVILSYAGDMRRCIEEGIAARKLAETKFDRKTSYRTIIELVNGLV